MGGSLGPEEEEVHQKTEKSLKKNEPKLSGTTQNKQETQIKGALRLQGCNSLKPSISPFRMGVSCHVKDLVP